MLFSATPADMIAMKYAGHSIHCAVHQKISLVALKAQGVFCVVAVCLFVFLMGSQGQKCLEGRSQRMQYCQSQNWGYDMHKENVCRV